MKNLGLIAYETYFSTMYPGTAIPPLTDEHGQEAWTAAAEAVVRESQSETSQEQKPTASFPEPDACAEQPSKEQPSQPPPPPQREP